MKTRAVRDRLMAATKPAATGFVVMRYNEQKGKQMTLTNDGKEWKCPKCSNNQIVLRTAWTTYDESPVISVNMDDGYESDYETGAAEETGQKMHYAIYCCSACGEELMGSQWS